MLSIDLRLRLSGLRFLVSDFSFVVSGIRHQGSAAFAPEAFGLEVCSFWFRLCSVGFRVSGFGFRGSEIVPGVSGVGLGIPVWGFGEVPEAEVALLERCHNRVAHLVQDLI